MTITRRDTIAGLVTLPAALTGFGRPADNHDGDLPIMGPAVFNWNDMKPKKTDTGEVRSICKSPTATVDQLEIHVTTLNPGMEPHPPHRHVNEELIIIREGDCTTLSNGSWIKVGPGSVIFNASNSLHGLRNIGATPAVYHVINWSPNKDSLRTH